MIDLDELERLHKALFLLSHDDNKAWDTRKNTFTLAMYSAAPELIRLARLGLERDVTCYFPEACACADCAQIDAKQRSIRARMQAAGMEERSSGSLDRGLMRATHRVLKIMTDDTQGDEDGP